MGIFLIVLGIIGIIVGIVCAVNKSSAKARVEKLCGAGKQKLGELLPILKETKEALSDIGDDGAIKSNVTVMGAPECDKTLTSPIGNMPCLYYKYKVTLKSIEVYYENDANGRRQRRERTHEDTLDSGESCVSTFRINDGTGAITVEPQDAEFDGLIKSVDRSEREFHNNVNGASINIGGLSINLGSHAGMFSNGMNMSIGSNMSRMNDGHRPDMIKYTEEIIGTDRNLTVVGTVCDSMGDFRMRSVDNNKLLISTKSASTMLAEAKSSIKNNGIGMIAGLVAGGICLLIGIIVCAAS